MRKIQLLSIALILTTHALSARGQDEPDAGPPKEPPSDDAMVRDLNDARKAYRKTLEEMRAHYIKVGDKKRATWAEQELIEYHRMLKHSFRLNIGDVPSEELRPDYNRKEANEMYMRAVNYKDRGFGTDYLDNQRRAEVLLQTILSKWPRCNKIGLVAYELGDLYESRAFRQYERSAAYFERSYIWDPTARHDARLRAARVYDQHLNDQGKAAKLYREVLERDVNPERREEARQRLGELGGR